VLDESGGWVHVQVLGNLARMDSAAGLEMPVKRSLRRHNEAARQMLPNQKTHEETSLFPENGLRYVDGWFESHGWRPASDGVQGAMDRWQLARSASRHLSTGISRSNMKVDGVVLVIDASWESVASTFFSGKRRLSDARPVRNR